MRIKNLMLITSLLMGASTCNAQNEKDLVNLEKYEKIDDYEMEFDLEINKKDTNGVMKSNQKIHVYKSGNKWKRISVSGGKLASVDSVFDGKDQYTSQYIESKIEREIKIENMIVKNANIITDCFNPLDYSIIFLIKNASSKSIDPNNNNIIIFSGNLPLSESDRNKSIKDRTYSIHLDKNKEYLPVMIKSRILKKTGFISNEYSFSDFRTVGNFIVPFLEILDSDVDGMNRKYTSRVNYFNFKNFIGTFFDVKLPVGSRVFDSKNDKYYKIGKDGSWIPLEIDTGRDKKMLMGILFISSVVTTLMCGLFLVMKRRKNSM